MVMVTSARPIGGRLVRAVEDAIRHALGAERLVALLAEHPGDGVHDVGFAAAVGPDDAGRAGAAECDHGALAERFKANDFHFSQLKQDVPFCRIPLVRVGLPHGQPSNFFNQQGRGFCARKETTFLSSKGG